jgi:hypothetical protein
MAVFGGVMAVLWRCSARLWRDLDVMAVFGDDYGGTWTTP